MCTVSYIAREEGCFITSNRDEHISRPMAMEPMEETINGINVLFPKDPQAGGTWFAMNQFGKVAVLLNGAFVNHQRQLPYAQSRGLVLLETIASENPEDTIRRMDLERIEPFTLILCDGGALTEMRWDGGKKHWQHLDANSDHIWSSVTLYGAEAIAQRNKLFTQFLEAGQTGKQSIIDFHSNNHQDYENGFVIDRSTGLKTFSVTQVVLQGRETFMTHLDLLKDKKYHAPFPTKEPTLIK